MKNIQKLSFILALIGCGFIIATLIMYPLEAQWKVIYTHPFISFIFPLLFIGSGMILYIKKGKEN